MADTSPLFLTTIAARTAIVLLALVVGIRLFGRREMGGMTVFDLVVVLALANAVQNAMTKGSGVLAVGFVSAGTLFVADRLLAALFLRRPIWEARLTGVPIVIAQDGLLERENMYRQGVTEEEVMAAVRGFGLSRLNQVKLAVLEADGSISVVSEDEPTGGTKE
jgi:uncharacterized membrane protein YcaP (DUF421 family)